MKQIIYRLINTIKKVLVVKKRLKLDSSDSPLISALRKENQANVCEFKVSLVYSGSSRTDKSTHSEILSQKQNITKPNNNTKEPPKK